MELTEKEKSLLGKYANTTKHLSYGGKFGDLPRGTCGKIVDFGSQSGEPAIETNRGRYIVPWDALVIIRD